MQEKAQLENSKLNMDFLKYTDEEEEETAKPTNPDEMGFLAKKQFKVDQ
jgi:hypothetical protein